MCVCARANLYILVSMSMLVCIYVRMYVKFVSHGHERAQCTLYRAINIVR